MNKTELLAWLKAMQNGTIGEARTRAFLIDRFWVLERSVDINGADFIIQRRITASNLLDESPPRFGIVQAKFFSSQDTSHYIQKQYLTDNDREIRKEFFVVCHTGTEDDTKSYLLTSQDLITDFEVTSGDKIKIPGRKLFQSSKYEILLKTQSLDLMEQALILADFKKNRAFLSWFLPEVRFDPNHIDPIYKESIDNWWGDIPEGFIKLKKTAQKALYDLGDLHRDLTAIIQESDPEKALAIAEEIYRSFKGGHDLSLPLPNDLYDEELHAVVLHHKEKVTTLKNVGLLDPFIGMRDSLLTAIVKDLAPYMPIDPTKVYRIEMHYDPVTLGNIVITGNICPATNFAESLDERNKWGCVIIPGFAWYELRSKGIIIVCCLLGRYSTQERTEGLDWESYIKNEASYLVYKILDEIYDLEFLEAME
jgi:hypothetical protein